ncbi:MAG: ABC transporter ATP-binding protein [Candidatus Omnitrophica bacterium]|nr:ABC transporter ATP-binding protein [Candidatus Omnitrophota bacterium]
MDRIIEVFSLAKAYRSSRDGVRALYDVNLHLDAKDYVSVVGPSGAGKSTLLHVIGGLDAPTRGNVFFRDKDIYRMNESKRAAWRNNNIGFVFQFYHLIEELNVIDNVALGAFNKARKSALKEAQKLLKYLGLQERMKFFPSQLSGGERQRVAIARALINDPLVLLCDEPTGNLDIESQDLVMGLFEKLHEEKNMVIMMVTHNLELAKRAKRTVFIKAGIIQD